MSSATKFASSAFFLPRRRVGFALGASSSLKPVFTTRAGFTRGRRSFAADFTFSAFSGFASGFSIPFVSTFSAGFVSTFSGFSAGFASSQSSSPQSSFASTANAAGSTQQFARPRLATRPWKGCPSSEKAASGARRRCSSTQVSRDTRLAWASTESGLFSSTGRARRAGNSDNTDCTKEEEIASFPKPARFLNSAVSPSTACSRSASFFARRRLTRPCFSSRHSVPGASEDANSQAAGKKKTEGWWAVTALRTSSSHSGANTSQWAATKF